MKPGPGTSLVTALGMSRQAIAADGGYGNEAALSCAFKARRGVMPRK